MKHPSTVICPLLLGASSVGAAITNFDASSADSIKSTASEIAYGMVKYYTGNNTGDVPGNLPVPYYWWETGAMFGALIDYWYYTGDDTYNEITTQAMLHQVGPNEDYMPPNQTKTEGNDDQSFWGLAAMSAAEVNFPNPPSTEPQWLALAQAVFNSQVPRWDPSTCGGGLRWQIFTFNNGYNYKNTISNGCFFNIGARLARYTGNQTYADWALKMWDWIGEVGLMDENYHFYDGSDDTLNCTQINHLQWSYNAGVFLYGAAIMYNISSDSSSGIDAGDPAVWEARVNGIVSNLSVFFKDNIMFEVACETNGKCDVDQRSFKAYLARWMAATSKVAPFTASTLLPLLKTSAVAAVSTCSGGTDGNACGLTWWNGAQNDGSIGVGEQMSALEVVQSNLITAVGGPLTNKTGGTSAGDPNAGSNSNNDPITYTPISTSDRAGASIITLCVLSVLFSGAYWMGVKS